MMFRSKESWGPLAYVPEDRFNELLKSQPVRKLSERIKETAKNKKFRFKKIRSYAIEIESYVVEVTAENEKQARDQFFHWRPKNEFTFPEWSIDDPNTYRLNTKYYTDTLILLP